MCIDNQDNFYDRAMLTVEQYNNNTIQCMADGRGIDDEQNDNEFNHDDDDDDDNDDDADISSPVIL